MKKKRFSLPLKVGTLLFVGLFVVLLSGYFSYRSLNEVITLLSQINMPNTGLTTLQELNTSIEEAENNMRQYVINNRNSSRNKYYENLEDIDSSINILYSQYPEDDWFRLKIDTIKKLIYKKMGLWEELAETWKKNASSVEISDITKEIPIKDTTTSTKRGFLARIFSPKKEQDTLDYSRINEMLTDLENEERNFETQIILLESELANTSNALSKAFISLIMRLEEYEDYQEAVQQMNADELASEAYKMLTLFSVCGTLLGIFVVLLLISYTRKNRKYNEILKSSRIAAEELAKSKELFMANVSHEIRTPLNAISGYIKQLMEMPVGREIKDKLKVVDTAGDQLIRLINDVLDFTKLQSGKLSLNDTHFEPGMVINEACTLFNDLAAKNRNTIKVSIENPENLVLYGDKNRFQQVLYNLLSNAVKFTENGVVEVESKIKHLQDEKVEVSLRVKDNGLGIESSKLETIFKEYSQADQQVSIRYGGTGLGLSIVKKIAELLEGDVAITSTKGAGTIVTCKLYFRKGSKEKLPVEIEKITQYSLPAKMKILVADDESYNRSLLAMILDKWRVEYDIATNGVEVIEKLNEKKYNVILMDLRMPVIDGKMATKFIRDTMNLSPEEVRVIGLTADYTKKSSEDLEELFTTILIKPFSEDDLFRAVAGENPPEETPGEAGVDVEKGNHSADLSNLVRVAGNDLNFVREMIVQFEDSTFRGLDDIQESCNAGDFQKVDDLAHMLIPACRHLDIKNLVKYLKDIETGAEKKNKQEILELVISARGEVKIALDSLNSQFEKLNFEHSGTCNK